METLQKKSSWVPTILALLLLLVLGGMGYFWWQAAPNTPIQNNPNTQVKGDQTEVGLPMRLTIPSINIDAQVIYVGLAADGSVDVPKGPDQVAWYQLGPRPGQQGSAVITGHFGPWKNGAHSVFDNLENLKVGDTIYITDDRGAKLTFKVRQTRTYEPTQTVPEVFNKTDGIYLNLITCHGDWLANQKTYTKRLVIFSDKII